MAQAWSASTRALQLGGEWWGRLQVNPRWLSHNSGPFLNVINTWRDWQAVSADKSSTSIILQNNLQDIRWICYLSLGQLDRFHDRLDRFHYQLDNTIKDRMGCIRSLPYKSDSFFYCFSIVLTKLYRKETPCLHNKIKRKRLSRSEAWTPILFRNLSVKVFHKVHMLAHPYN